MVDYFLVDECKGLYRCIRDAARYRNRKIAGKSGDSGDETFTDEFTTSDSDNYLAFLTPSPHKFPRKSMTFGGATSTIPRHPNDSRANNSEGSSKRIGPNNTSGGMDDDEINKMIDKEESDYILKISSNIDGDNDASNSSVYNYVGFL